ncbi:MAG: CO dehydrogenase/acetyl-CoA synthase complex subunit epsilon [Candidatus Bathyarchaeota archaeon]|nr:CO dehydrogenase/acetyl-CoA synthase complex subunit epsilon [Candidatus Bathyarchaeota archaeon]
MKRLNSPADLERLRREIIAKRDPKKPTIAVCISTGCQALGAQEVLEAFREMVKKQGLEGKVDIRCTGCLGFCEGGPRVVVYPQEIFYFRVKPTDVPLILSKTVLKNEILEHLLYRDPVTGKTARHLSEIPFYRFQNRLLLENNAKIDPTNIEDYIALGGYSALCKALFEMTPKQVLEEVKKSNIRGRGGGGFPTGRKWETARNAPGEPKYVIVNCDEGDPGVFANRALMEGNPHIILEGLIIGAYAVGASEGFIYVREEYPLAVKHMQIAIEQAEKYGLLGENILGSGFSFKVKIHRGAGAFVSGESSALMSAIEGKVGEPRPKYVHTAVKGVWDKPSVLNNVETWANIPLIINNGAEWFLSIGTEGSKGTKIFTLAGKVNNTGLIEVPMGITLREIIFKIGGGIRGGKKFKAVQVGGPSGGFIPEQYLDTPVDFDELVRLGAMMGSGGIIVMDSDTCMVDAARFFINFLCDESCGKCVPCREGLKQARKILDEIVAGRGKDDDIKTLLELAEVLRSASLCALGTTAANPLLTTLYYFRDEYEAHIRDKRCPALVCKDLLTFYIDPEKCSGCHLCYNVCADLAIEGDLGKIHVINQSKCTKCGQCFDVCPPEYRAVQKISGEEPPQILPEDYRWLKQPWQTAEVAVTRRAWVIANPRVAANIIQKASRPILVVGNSVAEVELDGKKLIDYVIDFASKTHIPVVASARVAREFINRNYKPAALMSLMEIGNKLTDAKWAGVDGGGPHDMALFIGFPYYMLFEVLSALKHFATNLITVNLDNKYNPQANWSLPNLNIKEWVNFIVNITSQLERRM